MCNVLRGDGIYVHVQVQGRRDFFNLEDDALAFLYELQKV